MSAQTLLTAEEFAETKFDLPDGGRWAELVAGRVVHLDPPDTAHGTTVLNLSKVLAGHLQQNQSGYACFELGMIVGRKPDTVRCPAVSYFSEGERFAETEKTVTETRPSFVVEIASSNNRRRQMRERVQEYLHWGVQLVWVADPIEKIAHVFQPSGPCRSFTEQQSLSARPVLEEFRVQVSELFAVPEWWSG